MKTRSLKKFMYLSIAAAVVTIGLKFTAYLKTGSMGFFSDALESFVNLFAAVIALILLHISEKPADEGHEYGHGKAEYFSSAIEGALILIAAFSIIYTSIPRIIHPQPLENLGIGTLFSVGASLVNLFAGTLLIQNGKKHRSMVLEADGKHLMTDVWTSAGVIAGVLVVKFTGLLVLDPIIAISGLMDASIPQEEIRLITGYFDSLKRKNVDYHSLLTRQAGHRKFISFHLLVPGNWTVKEGHDCAEMIEQRIENMFDDTVTVTTHIEPIEDPLSLNDIKIDRMNYSDDGDFDT